MICFYNVLAVVDHEEQTLFLLHVQLASYNHLDLANGKSSRHQEFWIGQVVKQLALVVLFHDQRQLSRILWPGFLTPLHSLFQWVVVLEQELLIHNLHDRGVLHNISFPLRNLLIPKVTAIAALSNMIVLNYWVLCLILLHRRYVHEGAICMVLLSTRCLWLQRHLFWFLIGIRLRSLDRHLCFVLRLHILFYWIIYNQIWFKANLN